MKNLFLIILSLSISAFAEGPIGSPGASGVTPPPQPTIEAVLAENELLRAQLREMQMSYQLLCSDPSIIEAKFATVQAKKKQADAAKPK